MTLVNTIWCASDGVQDSRTCADVLTHAVTELGELALEVQIHAGKSYKSAGSDGIVGEALDVIACMLDMIRVHDPLLTESDLIRMMTPKLVKWREKSDLIQANPRRIHTFTVPDPVNHSEELLWFDVMIPDGLPLLSGKLIPQNDQQLMLMQHWCDMSGTAIKQNAFSSAHKFDARVLIHHVNHTVAHVYQGCWIRQNTAGQFVVYADCYVTMSHDGSQQQT